MKVLLFWAGCLASIVSIAQPPRFEWAKNMGGTSFDVSNSIAVDGSGNVFTTGYFHETSDFDPSAGLFNLTSAGDSDIFISKLDPAGNFLWAKRMGGSRDDRGNSIVITSLGNTYITGFFNGTVDFDPGEGIYNLTSRGFQDMFIAKLTPTGTFELAKNIGGSNNEEGIAIALDVSGNVFITGYFVDTVDFDPGTGTHNLISQGDGDIFILKLDPMGNLLWAKNVGGAFSDRGNFIAVDLTGNVYTTGSFIGMVDFNPGTAVFNLTSDSPTYSDIFISKLDVFGNFKWAKNMGGPNSDEGLSIAVDALGNVYTTGYFKGTADFDPGSGSYQLTSTVDDDCFISKLDSSGNFMWAKNMEGTSVTQGRSIVLDAFGNIYISGYFLESADFDPGSGTFNLTSSGFSDLFVSKLDAFGNFVWATSNGGNLWDGGNSLSVDASGNVYSTGQFAVTVDFDPHEGLSNLTSFGATDIYILKISQLKTVGVNGSINSNNLTAFPNPTNGLITLVFSKAINTGHLELYNSMGVLVYQQTTAKDVRSIDLTPYPNGLYIAKWLGNHNEVFTLKLIKH